MNPIQLIPTEQKNQLKRWFKWDAQIQLLDLDFWMSWKKNIAAHMQKHLKLSASIQRLLIQLSESTFQFHSKAI